MRRIPRLLLLACLAFASLADPSGAQEGPTVDGSADFRTAPFIGDGTHIVDLVTGETVWFAVLYQNRSVPYSIEPRVIDPRPGVVANVTWYAPNLDVAADGAEIGQDDGSGPGFTGGSDVNAWFIAVRLTQEDGARGLRHLVELELDGFLSNDSEPCEAPDCELAVQLADLQDEIQNLDDRIAEGGEPDPAQEAEIADLNEQLAAVDAEIRELCGGEGRCEEISATSETPWPIVGVLAVVALGLVGAGVAVRRSPKSKEEQS